MNRPYEPLAVFAAAFRDVVPRGSIPSQVSDAGTDPSTLLLAVSGLLGREVAVEDLLDRLVERIASAMDADRATIYLVDGRSQEVFSQAAHLPELDEIRLPVGQGIAGWVAKRRGRPFVRTAVIGFVVTASHGVFDALTDGGSGVGFLWPLTNERFFFPWRPIPVAPVGHHFFGTRGLSIFLFEMLFFAPLTIWALWPHRRGAAGARDEAEGTPVDH